MEKTYFLPRPGQPIIEKIACFNFMVGVWSLSVLYRHKGKKFLSVLVLETGKQYTYEVS